MLYICVMKENNSIEQQFSQVEDGSGMETLSSPNEKTKKGNRILVDEVTLFFEEENVSGRSILGKAGKTPVECFTLYQKLKDCDFEKIGLDEMVNVGHPGIERFVTKEAEVFNYVINGEPEMTDQKILTPAKILQLAGIDPSDFFLVQLRDNGTEIVYAFSSDESIVMSCCGMKFITREWLLVVDIEEYGKNCKPVPPAKEYLIKVDKNKYPWHDRFITGKEVIGLEIKGPIKEYNLLKFYSNQPKPVPVGHDEKIDLTEKCVLRFVVQPKTQDDGERRNFSLPAEDNEFLNQTGFHWEAHLEGKYMWLLVHDYPIPVGYNVDKASVALMIPPSYPALQIDMAYFFPQLQKKSGRPINATTIQNIDGKTYQRWSRHRKSGEWKPGIDCVSTHLTLVNNWLLNDLKR